MIDFSILKHIIKGEQQMRIKKKMLVSLILLIASALMIALSPNELVLAQDETPYTAINWMVSEMDGSLQPYGVFIPTPSDKDTPRPILFIGHGAGGRATVPSSTAQPQKWILDNDKNWIVVRLDYRGPQANNQGQFDPFDVIKDLEEVKGYTLDHDRFFITGGSLGGSDAYRLALRYPDMWAGVAPQTGWTDYREFWPHWYEHSDKASVLRRSMFEGFQTTNLDTRNNVHNLTFYVDATIESMLELESPLWQVENGMHLPLYIMSCYDDPTNLRMNQEQIRDGYVEYGYDHVFKQVATGGHGCTVLDWTELMPWFDKQVRVTNPLVATYTTNSLQYNSAYWLQLDKFVTENEWAKLTATIDEDSQQSIAVQTENLAQFTLNLNDELINDMTAEVEVVIDGMFTINVLPTESLTFKALFDDNFVLTDWEVVAEVESISAFDFEVFANQPLLSTNIPLDGVKTALEKVNGVSGPFTDAMFSPFVVVYGTQGTEAQNADSLRSAQEFAMEWNNWMILHIGNYGSYQSATPGANVWEGIANFPYYATNRNANVPGGPTTEQVNTYTIRPIADVDLTFGDALSKNVILFGEPSSNGVIKYMEEDLPFELGVGSITIDGRTYADGVGNNPKDEDLIDYSFVYPNPLNTDKYIAVSRYGLWMDWKNPATAWLAFTSTGIEFQSLSLQFPDYFVGWRLDGKLMDGVHGMYFQDTWFEAGYFGGDWRLDKVAPITTALLSGSLENGLYTSQVELTLSAKDNPGGFGVSKTEYSLDGGTTWETYGGPILLTENGTYTVLYRSADYSGQFEYGMIDPWAQYGKAFQDGEQWVSFPSWSNLEDAKELTFTISKNIGFPYLQYLPLVLK